MELSRRDLARWALLGGGGAAALSSALCAPRVTGAVDRATPWWLSGNFAPVSTEAGPDVALTVDGAIPVELDGLYVRNGSNPARANSPHWFFGDGMVHGVRLERGRASWYANRYVRTSMYETGSDFGHGPPGGASNQANVSVIWHGNALLTSGEVGLPYRLDPATLTTLGVHDFAGKLSTSFTAHSKIDPLTGRMHTFGYGFVPPYLTYHVVEADGTLSLSQVIDVPRSTMIHDFAITDSDVVFWDLPVVFDLAAAAAYISDPTSGVFPYQWKPDAGARIGILPLGGGEIRWFEIDPCYVFHGVNAHRRGGEVVIDVCRLSSMFEPGQLFGGIPSLRRWTVDTTSGRVADEVLNDGEPGDLPTRDPRLVGRDYRFAYLVETRANDATVDLGGLIKHDMATGERTVWAPGAAIHSGEWLFVPTAGGEDEGFLLAFVYDASTARSDLAIIDATDVRRGPVARIHLPQRVPYGFHATWVPGGG